MAWPDSGRRHNHESQQEYAAASTQSRPTRADGDVAQLLVCGHFDRQPAP